MFLFICRRVIKAWSSGTGGAGIFGSLSYASLIAVGIPPQYTLLLFLVMPVLEAATFWVIRPLPMQMQKVSVATIELDLNLNEKPSPSVTQYGTGSRIEIKESKRNEFMKGLKRKLRLLPSVVKFMMPLMVVFICEYIIISGLVSKSFPKIDTFNELILLFSFDTRSWKWFMFAIRLWITNRSSGGFR